MLIKWSLRRKSSVPIEFLGSFSLRLRRFLFGCNYLSGGGGFYAASSFENHLKSWAELLVAAGIRTATAARELDVSEFWFMSRLVENWVAIFPGDGADLTDTFVSGILST